MAMKRLGIIGGLGPMATAIFLQMIVEMTDASVDQQHIEMIINHCPKIPDRTSFILGKSSENPVYEMMEAGKRLEEWGADIIAIPCVTAGYFLEELTSYISVPIINIVEITKKYLKSHHVHSVGLMATSGTIESGLFKKVFTDTESKLIMPSKERQQDVMHLIYHNIKANKDVEISRFMAVSKELREQGAEVIILGCTELSVLNRKYKIGKGYLDIMQLMAKAAVESCGRLKEEYQEIIARNEE